jgi:hypothetical protein
MKRLGSTLAVVFAITTAVAVPTQAAQQSGLPTFEVKRGEYLWHQWQAKYAGKDWSSFWQETCKLNQISCTDSAWRHMPEGRKITLPATTVLVANKDSIIAARNKEIAALKAEIGQLSQIIAPTITRTVGAPAWLQIIGLLAIIGLVLAVIVLSRSRAPTGRARHGSDHLTNTNRNARDLFVSRHGYEYRLPEGIKLNAGGDTIYFVRGEQLDKDPTVYVHGIREPVKIKYLGRALSNAHRETLEFYNITVTPASRRRAKSEEEEGLVGSAHSTPYRAP